MSTPFTGSLSTEENLKQNNALITRSLFNANGGTGSGKIAFNDESLTAATKKRAEIIDYIRLRLGDGLVDVELDKEHYELAINQALIKYRQRAQNSTEESYAFMEMLPETQEYILPAEIQQIRAVYRRGIGSVTGTTASQFEPFASGYLNTYMLVAGRVGGLVNYELFTQYQELAMRMFGGHLNFTFNPVTKKFTVVRKFPEVGFNYRRLTSLSANGTAVGSTITIVVEDPWTDMTVGGSIIIRNCPVGGYNGTYVAVTVSEDKLTVTVTAQNVLTSASVSNTGGNTNDLRVTQVYSPDTDTVSEIILLWTYNVKPDVMLFNDVYSFPWLQEYAYSFAKRILGEAREKFNTIAGPQGGTSLNGASLKSEAQAEMDALEQQLKDYVDGSVPLTWVIG
jgi:hypothetical protein